MITFDDGRPHVLMCRPDYFDIEYTINPWMNCQRQSDPRESVAQWNALFKQLQDHGVVTHEIPAVPGLPDLVFTANAALIYKRQAIVSRFRHPQRQGETMWNRRWLAAHGFQIIDLPDAVDFEGAGDALFCGDTLFAGYKIRSDAGGHQRMAEQIGVRVIPLELVDERFYHLDTCFCPLSPDTAVYYPGAFDAYGRKAIKEHIPELIEVSTHEAEQFACNAVVIGKRVITHIGCPALHDGLRRRGYQPQERPLGEFLKAGGSAKCLTLRLDGEDAAGWKTTR